MPFISHTLHSPFTVLVHRMSDLPVTVEVADPVDLPVHCADIAEINAAELSVAPFISQT